MFSLILVLFFFGVKVKNDSIGIKIKKNGFHFGLMFVFSVHIIIRLMGKSQVECKKKVSFWFSKESEMNKFLMIS